MRREDDDLALRHLGLLLDEDRAPCGELFDHMLVVDDLLAYVDRGTMLLECLLDGLDRPIDSGAVAAWGGQNDPFRYRCGGFVHTGRLAGVRCRPGAGIEIDRS